jgi:hypothetical protein
MGPVVSVGGVLIEEAQLRPLSAAMDAIARKFGVPENEEFKWSPKKGSWIYDYLHEGSREDCYREILEAAAAHNAKAAVVCWNTARTAEKDQAAFERCVDYLFERISMNLEDRGSSAIIVADKPGGGKDQEAEFLTNFVEPGEKQNEVVCNPIQDDPGVLGARSDLFATDPVRRRTKLQMGLPVLSRMSIWIECRHRIERQLPYLPLVAFFFLALGTKNSQ